MAISSRGVFLFIWWSNREKSLLGGLTARFLMVNSAINARRHVRTNTRTHTDTRNQVSKTEHPTDQQHICQTSWCACRQSIGTSTDQSTCRFVCLSVHSLSTSLQTIQSCIWLSFNFVEKRRMQIKWSGMELGCNKNWPTDHGTSATCSHVRIPERQKRITQAVWITVTYRPN